ncbi:MAG TPA: SpoIIE family protein phosphatase [Gaiellaceae bacterium]|nr:SpoIIE family protein phosphatase [Gaiellaceae bacterium]
MASTHTRPDLGEALAALSHAARALAAGATLEPALVELVAAAARGTGADVAVLWLPEHEGGLAARAVWSTSAGLVAEIEGLREASVESAVERVRGRLDPDAEALAIPCEVALGTGALTVVRRGAPFEWEEERLATLAADLAGLASALGAHGLASAGDAAGALDVAGDALAATADDEGAPGRVARLSALASGAEAALVWRLRDDALEVDGSYGTIQADAALGRAAASILLESRAAAVHGDSSSGEIVTLQLGQPALGALQLRFAPGGLPDELELGRLASFAVRAAHALRSSERAREARFELERSRALLSVVSEAISRLSLTHTLDTVNERVAELLGTDRVAVYLREEQRLAVAASRGIDGPHEAVAEALLEVALGLRRRGAIVEIADVSADGRLEPARSQLQESEIRSALALPLIVGDEPIGLLAAYPRGPRPLTPNESALLSALAAQLAVVVQNARLHERATALGSELEDALRSERDAAKRLQAQYAISRSFAQSLSLERTLEVLAESVVTLLGVDAAVIRMPDERGVELTPRAVFVNDERVDAAARALLSRPQPLARGELLDLVALSEPLVVDAEAAEELGGALALLAPFLRKGSSVAVIPIATSGELLATLTIVSLHPGRPVAGEIAQTALSIAGQAALAIDNARLYGQQKAFADTMQRSLLPREAPELAGLELGDVYESAARLEVGGDVYDYLTLGDGRLAVVLGDVTGHGVDATADMAMAKYVFRSLAREHPDPGAFLAAANDVVSSEIAPGRFITMVELVFDAVAGRVSCASGGHPPPRLVLPDGAVEGISAQGLALGIDAPQDYPVVTVDFLPGAIVVAYTDGVVEARRRGEQFGLERLDALLAESRALPPQEIAEAALAACREWTEGELTDDFAVVVIKRAPAA